MFPMVRSSPHPNGKYVAFQSSDNQIVVYASTERFRQNRKKGFRGHNNAYVLPHQCKCSVIQMLTRIPVATLSTWQSVPTVALS